MKLDGVSVAVTGGSSGLGMATAKHLIAAGSRVMLIDVRDPDPAERDALGDGALFATADITDQAAVDAAFDVAEREHGPLRGLVHCAGRGGDRLRIVDRDGQPGPLDTFAEVIRVNLVGAYNVLRLAAARMLRAPVVDGERAAIVLTASVAAFDGQIGQTSYTAAKAGVHGMTLVAARDLASSFIRVNTIAPGVFDTPMLGRLRQDLRDALAASVPNPPRLGDPTEFAMLAAHMLQNRYLNGETVRLDGAIRMAPR